MRMLITAAALLALAALAAPPAAGAATGSATTATADAARTAAAARIGDDYPYKNDSWENPDPWNFYKRECTSFAAWRLRQLGVPFHNHYKTHWGNANHWDDAARAVGIRVDDTPTVGSIAQWNSGRFGHVAYVAEVANGQVLLEEYNYRGSHEYGTRRLSASSVENYLHIAR